jgi:hypothetical protein
MMGPEKLSTIRDELATALAGTGKDPIQWLEDRLRQLEKEHRPAPTEREVLQALVRVLQGSKKAKWQPARAKSKSH